MLFSLNEWGPLNGNNSCKTYNFRIKVRNVQGSFVVKSDLLFCEQGTISTGMEILFSFTDYFF